MPRVKEAYLLEKREEIIDCAFRVCNRKPTYDVTMSDIVAESGMSQGGVYKYFGNIEEVFAALINRANQSGTKVSSIDEIINSQQQPKEKLEALFTLSEEYFSDMLLSYNKILFELGTFFAQNPEKCAKISAEVTTQSFFAYLIQAAIQLITTETQTGYFQPILPLKDVISYAVTSFDGIIRDVTLSKCYPGQNQEAFVMEEHSLIHSLTISILYLLGCSTTGKEHL